MALHIRTINDDDLLSWMDVKGTAFFSHYPAADSAAYRRQLIDLGRTWAALDGDTIVATLRSFTCDLTLPGGAIVPADAVTNVSTRAR